METYKNWYDVELKFLPLPSFSKSFPKLQKNFWCFKLTPWPFFKTEVARRVFHYGNKTFWNHNPAKSCSFPNHKLTISFTFHLQHKVLIQVQFGSLRLLKPLKQPCVLYSTTKSKHPSNVFHNIFKAIRRIKASQKHASNDFDTGLFPATTRSLGIRQLFYIFYSLVAHRKSLREVFFCKIDSHYPINTEKRNCIWKNCEFLFVSSACHQSEIKWTRSHNQPRSWSSWSPQAILKMISE